MRTSGFWLVLGTLVLVPVLGFVSNELVQRRRFSTLQGELNGALHEFQREARVVPSGIAGRPLRLASASEGATTFFQVGTISYDKRTAEGMADWLLTAEVTSPEHLDVYTSVSVSLRQERKFLLLLSPRVLVVAPSSVHESVWGLFDRLLEDQSIHYTRTNTLP